MNFKPANDDHSIVETVFSIQLDNGIPIPNLRSLADAYHGKLELSAEHRSMAATLRDDLPFFKIYENQHTGILLGRVKPDGDPSWRLSVAVDAVDQIKFTCKSYTRWAKVWGKIEKHLVEAITFLMLGNQTKGTDHRPMPNVTGIGLSVLDRFFVERSLDEAIAPHSDVLKQSKYLPDCLIDNVEYFNLDMRLKTFGAAHVERLNVASFENSRSEGSNSVIDIRHELDIHDLELSFADIAVFMAAIRPQVNELHNQNKAMLKQVLSDEASSCILLSVESEA